MAPMPRVIHLSTATTWRGGEQQLGYLAMELKRAEVPQLVVCAADSPMMTFCKERSLAHRTIRPRMSFDPLAARALARIAREWKADLLHAHDSHGHTAAVLANTFFGMKLPLVISRRVDFAVSSGFSARFKYGHPSVRRILCVSDAIRTITAKGIRDPSVLRTVHSGIDPGRFADGPDGRLRRELGLGPEHRLIGSVAALAPHKDLFTFIRMAERIATAEPHARFVLIGEGDLKEQLMHEVARRKLTERITFTGFRKDLERILPELDVMVMTSTTEGLGTSVLDAFACGVPVVATKAGGIPEMIVHEVSGLLRPVSDDAQLADEVLRVLHDPVLHDQLTQGGRERLRSFTVEATAQRTLEEYQAVLEEAREGSPP